MKQTEILAKGRTADLNSGHDDVHLAVIHALVQIVTTPTAACPGPATPSKSEFSQKLAKSGTRIYVFLLQSGFAVCSKNDCLSSHST